MQLDRRLLHWLNGSAAAHSQAASLVTWIAQNMVTVIVVTTVVGWLVALACDSRSHRSVRWQILECAAVATVALAVGMATNQLIGHAWFRPRPSDALPYVHLLLPASSDPSFPSDHAMAGFVIALAVSRALPRLGVLLMAEAALLSISRVAVGLHYPSDVLGGILVALIATGIAQALLIVLRPRMLRLAVVCTHRFIALRVEPAPALLSSGMLRAGSIVAAFLALPVLIEATVDPIRFAAEPMEVATWVLMGALLAAAAVGCGKLTATRPAS